MSERVEVDLIVKAITKGFAQVRGDFKKVAEEQKKSQTAAEGLKEAWLKMAAVVGTVTVAIGTMKKAYDFAEAGAEVMQMGESWDLLLDKVGAAPNLLDQLQKSSRGTISDMDLMTSTATLLAGASGELATSLADATPELLEIAKAANKLNPSLGSTAFLYESISTGIKRASPLILDNLGLTIKVGAANEAMAKKLGKTVAELTVQEKSMAILNDTMRAGAVLIDQVGGSVDAAGDDLAQFTTNLKNLTDGAKETYYEALSPLIQGMVDLQYVASGSEVSTNLLSVALGTLGIDLDLIHDALEDLHDKAEEARLKELETAEATEALAQAARDAAAPFIEGFELMRLAAEGLAEGAGDAAEEVSGIALALTEVTAATLAAEAMRALDEAYKDGNISIQDYKIAFSDIATNIAGMDSSAIMAIVHLAELEKEYEDGITDADEYAAKLLDLKRKINAIESKEVTVTVYTRYMYGEGGVGGGPDYGGQSGGAWSGQSSIAVGEVGEEWIFPSGNGYVVIPADTVQRFKSLGMKAGAGLQYGGEFGGSRYFPGSGMRPKMGYDPSGKGFGGVGPLKMNIVGPGGTSPKLTAGYLGGGGGAVVAAPSPAVSTAAVSESQQIAQITAETVTAGVASTLATTQAEQIVALRTTLAEQTRETKKQIALLKNIREAIVDQGTMEDLGDIMIAGEE